MQTSPPSPNSPSTIAWSAIGGLVLFTALCLLAGAAEILRLAYPAGAFAVGVLLYQRQPILYIGFAWWIAFLTPFVRRLIDLQSGWVEPSPVLLAPFLVMMVSGLTFVRYLPKSYQRGGLPFILSALGITYGLLVGLIKNSPTAVVVPFLNWFAPLLFGFYLYANWRIYPLCRQNLQRVFLWGVLITGAYGIWQYLTAPEWDRFWLTNTGALAFGIPEPLGMRVFSTMNSPGPFAMVMMAGLLLLFAHQNPLRFVAAGTGYLAFLLSLVRSAWLGWVVGILTFLPSLKPRFQMQLIVTVLVISICVLPLANLEPFSEVIGPRVESFFNTKEDVSLNERLEGYDDTLIQALVEIPGNGFGFVIEHDVLGSNDSGILTLLFTLGWFGTIPYLGGILLLLFSMFQNPQARLDPFVSAARSISVGAFAQIGLGNPTLALSGMVFWTFVGVAIASQQYYTQVKRNVENERSPNPLPYPTSTLQN